MVVTREENDMAENEMDPKNIEDESLEEISGGKPLWGTWYVATLKSGTHAQFYSYDEALEYINSNGGGDIESRYGIMSKKRFRQRQLKEMGL